MCSTTTSFLSLFVCLQHSLQCLSIGSPSTNSHNQSQLLILVTPPRLDIQQLLGVGRRQAGDILLLPPNSSLLPFFCLCWSDSSTSSGTTEIPEVCLYHPLVPLQPASEDCSHHHHLFHTGMLPLASALRQGSFSFVYLITIQILKLPLSQRIFVAL